MNRTPRSAFLPTLDALEARVQLSATHVATHLAPTAQFDKASTGTITIRSTIADRMVAYLEAHRRTRIGGGECAHLASEALRIAGGQFAELPKDSPNSGDYVWGSLVKVIEVKGGKLVDSKPSSALKPGDIIQYRNTNFSALSLAPAHHKVVGSPFGGSAAHHTAVVAAVNSSGRATMVYEQNTNGNRTDLKHNFDISKMTAGWVRIYRPMARVDKPGHTMFTIVNNTTSSQSYQVFYGSNGLPPTTLTKANTAGSYYINAPWTTGTTRPTLKVNGKSIALTNGAGYEIYTNSSGSTSVRQI